MRPRSALHVPADVASPDLSNWRIVRHFLRIMRNIPQHHLPLSILLIMRNPPAHRAPSPTASTKSFHSCAPCAKWLRIMRKWQRATLLFHLSTPGAALSEPDAQKLVLTPFLLLIPCLTSNLSLLSDTLSITLSILVSSQMMMKKRSPMVLKFNLQSSSFNLHQKFNLQASTITLFLAVPGFQILLPIESAFATLEDDEKSKNLDSEVVVSEATKDLNDRKSEFGVSNEIKNRIISSQVWFRYALCYGSVYGVAAIRPFASWFYVGKQQQQISSTANNKIWPIELHEQCIIDFDPG
ncbi:hypothetical protein L195_g006657 [Trifolium pratense]|uniref:Uncharacterized protein n=1 Tax=Trifolium pratense TaxID=57577 RepID=A0A2K3P496_TRIPR|nr:hypothetical protein L195_g006657 [Trifolium pratense]